MSAVVEGGEKSSPFERIKGCIPDYYTVVPLLLIIVTAFSVRIYLLRFYDVISSDGIGYVAAARNLATGDMNSLSSNGFYVFMTWLVGQFTPDFELSGRLVSVIFGSVLVVPLYLLGSELFSRRTALAVCLVTSVWPSLLGWSCEVMTQAMFTTLIVTGYYLVWRMCRDQSPRFAAWAGITLGLAFLTRTEAALLFLALPVFPLVMMNGDNRRIMARPILAYAGAFIVLCGMHVILLKVATGSWQLSVKTSAALNDAVGRYLNIEELSFIPGVKQPGYLDIITSYPGFLWTNSGRNLVDTWNTMVPLPLWILAALGFSANGFGKTANARRLYLVTTFSPFAVIILFYYIGPEYTQPYLPVLFLWCAEGARMAERALSQMLAAVRLPIPETVAAYAPFTLIASFIYASVLLASQIPSNNDHSNYSFQEDGARRDHKRIGLLLKANLPPGKIMTRSGRIAYYAERDWMTIPNTDVDGIFKAAVEGGARFLVLDGLITLARPELASLMSPLITHQYPERFFYVSDPKKIDAGLFMLIYRDPSSVGVIVHEIERR